MTQEHRFSRRAFLRQSAASAALGSGLTLGASLRPAHGEPEAGDIKPRGVVLVTFDTLRADHLPLHGYPRRTAPFLTELAARSVVFERATTSSSHTSPAHLSIFSGLHLPQHRFMFNGQKELSPRVRTLAEFFKANGYATAGLSSVAWLKKVGRGFDVFRGSTPRKMSREERGKLLWYVQGHEQVDRAIEWIGQRDQSEPFFLWLHLWDPHTPFFPLDVHRDKMAVHNVGERMDLLEYWTRKQHKRLDGKAWGNNADALVGHHALYDAEIHFADSELRRLYESMTGSGHNARTVWIITADHGEGLGSHDYIEHGERLYQEQLHIPLIFHGPEGWFKARRTESLVQHVDLVPTLAELVGACFDAGDFSLTGTSLLPVLTGAEDALPDRLVYAERRGRTATIKDQSINWEADPIFCVSDGRYKYTHHTTAPDEFYDLWRDPFELTNRFKKSGKAKRMRKRALALREEMSREAGDTTPGEFDEDYLEALEALGYMGGAEPEPGNHP